jgi:hypothetical protein
LPEDFKSELKKEIHLFSNTFLDDNLEQDLINISVLFLDLQGFVLFTTESSPDFLDNKLPKIENKLIESAYAFLADEKDIQKAIEKAMPLFKEAYLLGLPSAPLEIARLHRANALDRGSHEIEKAIKYLKEGIDLGDDRCYAELADLTADEKDDDDNALKMWNNYFHTKCFIEDKNATIRINRNIALYNFLSHFKDKLDDQKNFQKIYNCIGSLSDDERNNIRIGFQNYIENKIEESNKGRKLYEEDPYQFKSMLGFKEDYDSFDETNIDFENDNLDFGVSIVDEIIEKMFDTTNDKKILDKAIFLFSYCKEFGEHGSDEKKQDAILKAYQTQIDTDNWNERTLCSDGNCIGVIGSNGYCKECGKHFS